MPPRDLDIPVRSDAVAEERGEPPFEGGSQPISHEKDPLPGPGANVARWATFALAALVLAGVLIYVLGRL